MGKGEPNSSDGGKVQHKQKLTDDKARAIKRMLEANASYRTIQRYQQCSPNTVVRVKRLDIPPRLPRPDC
jgi:DNA invertase Pin-like site-specific DNA recombinase